MKCPTCEKQLQRVLYEDLVAHHCENCDGYLLDISRFKVIQARPEEDMAKLQKEIEEASEAKDTVKRIRCPHCREKMEKRPKHFGLQKFFVDQCHRCNLIWLDAGELAKLRLKFESSERGVEQHKMIDRRANMSPEERRELDERIDQLPEYAVFKHMFGKPHRHFDEAIADEFFHSLKE